MTIAKIHCSSSVNVEPFGFATLHGNSEHLSSESMRRMFRTAEGGGKRSVLFEDAGRVFIGVRSRLTDLKGLPEDWLYETNATGKKTNRANIVSIVYELDREEVLAKGLPTEEALWDAVRADTKDILSKVYENGTGLKKVTVEPRKFTLTKKGLPSAWEEKWHALKTPAPKETKPAKAKEKAPKASKKKIASAPSSSGMASGGYGSITTRQHTQAEASSSLSDVFGKEGFRNSVIAFGATVAIGGIAWKWYADRNKQRSFELASGAKSERPR